MKCKPKKYANGGPVRVFADGGKPTYLKSVAAKIGIGDGYDYFPPKAAKATKPKDTRRKIDVSNATSEFGNVMAKHKKALDET